MTEIAITPNEAAKRLGIGRSSVMRALKSGKLEGYRDNSGHWKIPLDALERYKADRPAPKPDFDRTPSAVTPSDSPETLARLAATEAERDQLRERLDEVRADRDQWREMADKLAARPRRSLWPWGRS